MSSSSLLIGKGRRVTLAELLSISRGTMTVEWMDPTVELPEGVETVAAQLSQVSLQDSLPRAVVALVALHAAQGRWGSDDAALRLVQAVGLIPKDKPLDTLDLIAGKPLPAPAVSRSIQLAVDAVALQQALEIVSTAALPIAALSLDLAGTPADALAEVHYDVARPHRGMVAAAATLRALLNGSKIASENSTGTTVPQYHGPALTALQQAAKTLELEVNSMAVDGASGLDTTVADLAVAQAQQAVTLLCVKSLERQGASSSGSTTFESLQAAVDALQSALQNEAKTANAQIQTQLAQAAQEAADKEAQKAARAPADPTKPATDEFAGKTEAQIATILRKRAEKEAKAAAKRKAKEGKKATLFGDGIVPICEALQTSNFELTPACCAELSALVDKFLSGGVQRKPKIPKGTRDYLPEQMMIRQQAFGIIRRVFQAHGAVEIDTPVFELKDTLTGKYGEDSKLIYDLADQGGELLALRYDLTVPFARFLALNSVGNIKRFHIGKVYRRDQPALNRGRYREFYQCDFDIAGVYGRMVPDSECLCVVCDILDALPIGDFGVKLNHRRLLDAILEISGVPADKFRTICSAVDKLDKEPWSEVKREMVEDKGLSDEVADKIGEFVLNKGEPWALYKQIMDEKRFGDHVGANEALEDLRILFDYLEAMGKLKFISFDLSLARGLDYYTGVIYEAVCMSGEAQVGSIGGGGRYDNLVSMFQEAGKQTPCVGVSVGIERVFTLMEARLREEQGGSIKQPNVDILIASAGDAMMKEKMNIARILWDAKLSAEFSQKESAKLKRELQNALDRGIPFMVIVGEAEWKENKCVVKDIVAKTEETVALDDLVSTLRSKGVVPVGCEFAAELLKEN